MTIMIRKWGWYNLEVYIEDKDAIRFVFFIPHAITIIFLK